MKIMIMTDHYMSEGEIEHNVGRLARLSESTFNILADAWAVECENNWLKGVGIRTLSDFLCSSEELEWC